MAPYELLPTTKRSESQVDRKRRILYYLIGFLIISLLGFSYLPDQLSSPVIASDAICGVIPTVRFQPNGAIPRSQDAANRTKLIDSELLPRLKDGVNVTEFSLPNSTCQTPPNFKVDSALPYSIPTEWKDQSIMFGMSSLASRVFDNIPVWASWIPRIDETQSLTTAADLPLLLVLTVPGDEAIRVENREKAEGRARGLGINMALKQVEANRHELRYFDLVQEMYKKAMEREVEEGIVTDWFVFLDDDTFFIDWKEVVAMLSAYDPSEVKLVGSLSESTGQLWSAGHFAFGGAGIFVSRVLMKKMVDSFELCLDLYGKAAGGDAMVSYCAAFALDPTTSSATHVLMKLRYLLDVEESLHQLDIKGDADGFFQSGFRITSLHHFFSWFSLFPKWHPCNLRDVREPIILIGEISKIIGGVNFGRRYVFDNVVVALGYSITIYRTTQTLNELEKSEHTWTSHPTFHPMRKAMVEGVDKMTYYVSDMETLSESSWAIEHINIHGGKMRLIWDASTLNEKSRSSGHSWVNRVEWK